MKKVAKLLIGFSVSVFVLFILFQRIGYNLFAGFSGWQSEGVVIEKGQDTNQNPDIIQLSNGCFRLYSHGSMMDGNGMMSIYSYRSCDGLHWEFEGKRIDEAAMPAAILAEDGNIRLYFQRGVENHMRQALMMAVSDDGLDFKVNETPLLITGRGELSAIKAIAHFELIQLDQGYRMYFDESGLTPVDFEKYKNENWTWPVWRIRSLYSGDGLHWNLEPEISIDYEQEPLRYMQRAGSCTVMREGDSYHMYFGAGFSPWEDLKWWKRWTWSGIYEAISDDGLHWKIMNKNIFEYGSDPEMIRMGDTIRMYVSEGHRGESNSIESFVKE